MFYEKIDSEIVKKIKKIENITGVDYEIMGEFIPIDSWKILAIDLLRNYKTLERKLEQAECDYNPEIEVPEIHGKGISW